MDSHRIGFFGLVRRRLVVTIASSVGWLCAVLLFLAFWAGRFSLFQDIVIVVVSLLILGGIVFGAWVSLGLSFVDRWD